MIVFCTLLILALIGIFVGIMAITLAYTEQYIVWLIMIPAAAASHVAVCEVPQDA